MRKLLYIGVIILTLNACENENALPYCGDIEGVETNWVQTQIEELKAFDDEWSYIVEVEYKGELVYSVQGCHPAALYALIYFRCNGERIEGPYDPNDFQNQRVIWKPKDSRCNF